MAIDFSDTLLCYLYSLNATNKLLCLLGSNAFGFQKTLVCLAYLFLLCLQSLLVLKDGCILLMQVLCLLLKQFLLLEEQFLLID